MRKTSNSGIVEIIIIMSFAIVLLAANVAYRIQHGDPDAESVPDEVEGLEVEDE